MLLKKILTRIGAIPYLVESLVVLGLLSIVVWKFYKDYQKLPEAEPQYILK